MPIFRAGSKLVYFAHVPKCAGTSVEHYLKRRFGAIGMHDPKFGNRDQLSAWTLSPPQHIPEPVRRDLLPDELFDALFATVRHPITRIISVFRFSRDIERMFSANTTFSSWLEDLYRIYNTSAYAMNGHIRSMNEIVPKSATIFKMESEMDAIEPWLDELCGATAPKYKIEKKNVLKNRLSEQQKEQAFVRPTDKDLSIIFSIYREDFDRFGYDPEKFRE